MGSSARPRVVINDRVLYQKLTGVGHYVEQLIAALQTINHEFELDPFLTRRTGPPRRLTEPLRAAAESPALRTRRSDAVRRMLHGGYHAAFRLGAGWPALYHEPNHVPLRCRIPTVTTIHDLSVLVHPEWHPADRVRWYERSFAAGVRQTRHFLAASSYTRDQMQSRLGVAPDRITVTLLAARPAFTPRGAAEIAAVRAAYGLPADFLLFVGTLEPRKNIVGLLEAFAGLPPGVRRRAPLVLAGGWGWGLESIPDSLARHGLLDDVRLIGYQPDAALAALYSACTALVWPTHYEGFGLPPLEAMACGAAVITSNTTSLPEVVGDAGVLLDPTDVPQWTECMRRVMEDDAWRAELRARGPQRASRFSWRRCAEQTLDVYRSMR